jgi:hypothetical protein
MTALVLTGDRAPGLVERGKARGLGKGRYAPREGRGGLRPSLTEAMRLAL